MGPAPTDLESKDSAESYAIRVSNLIFRPVSSLGSRAEGFGVYSLVCRATQRLRAGSCAVDPPEIPSGPSTTLAAPHSRLDASQRKTRAIVVVPLLQASACTSNLRWRPSQGSERNGA